MARRARLANPGIESLPQLNSTSAPNTWQFTQAQGVAPAGTTQVKVYALFVDQSAGTGFFDDLQASLIPANPSVLGDYNSNNIVDAADYTVWRDHLGQAFTLPNRDTNNSGNVNQQDYTFWKGRFGAISGAGALSGARCQNRQRDCLRCWDFVVWLGSHVESSRQPPRVIGSNITTDRPPTVRPVLPLPVVRRRD